MKPLLFLLLLPAVCWGQDYRGCFVENATVCSDKPIRLFLLRGDNRNIYGQVVGDLINRRAWIARGMVREALKRERKLLKECKEKEWHKK